jgi:hypothetical protein
MGSKRLGLVLAAGAVGLVAGCVDRRFLVETDVPGAQVYVDGKLIGASPADAQWEYAGCRRFTAVAPGYEPLVQDVNFAAKWYEFPPLDFFAEVLWPFRIEDRRLVQLHLEPTRPVNEAALVGAADGLRARGQALPPTSVPPSTRPATALPPPLPTGSGPLLPVPNNFVQPNQPSPFTPGGIDQPLFPTVPGGVPMR